MPTSSSCILDFLVIQKCFRIESLLNNKCYFLSSRAGMGSSTAENMKIPAMIAITLALDIRKYG